MTRALRTASLALLAAFTLGACGGATTPATATTSPPPASTAPAAPAGTAAAPALDAQALDAQALCDFLEKEAPSLESVGSPVGALARFAGDYGTWIEGGPGRQLSTSAELDAVTTSSCPEARNRILAALGAPSFSDALG